MSNKKLFFYLNTENPEQNELLSFYEKERNKTQTVRDGLSLVFELRKLNENLPELLKAVLQSSGKITDIKAIFDIIEGLNEDTVNTVKEKKSLYVSEEEQYLKNRQVNNIEKKSVSNAKKIFGKK
ncbi:hypothetical protein ABN236_18810 [Proteus sp. fly-1013]|uniref:hypothetical protein n=1 Tax=Proteus sp. fly-1013 TaxID=3136673 RepID=UPI0032DB27A0